MGKGKGVDDRMNVRQKRGTEKRLIKPEDGESGAVRKMLEDCGGARTAKNPDEVGVE